MEREMPLRKKNQTLREAPPKTSRRGSKANFGTREDKETKKRATRRYEIKIENYQRKKKKKKIKPFDKKRKEIYFSSSAFPRPKRESRRQPKKK